MDKLIKKARFFIQNEPFDFKIYFLITLTDFRFSP